MNSYQNLYTQAHRIFEIAKTLKQYGYPSVNEWLNKCGMLNNMVRGTESLAMANGLN